MHYALVCRHAANPAIMSHGRMQKIFVGVGASKKKSLKRSPHGEKQKKAPSIEIFFLVGLRYFRGGV